jgi:hypothetical protein
MVRYYGPVAATLLRIPKVAYTRLESRVTATLDILEQKDLAVSASRKDPRLRGMKGQSQDTQLFRDGVSA